MRVKKDKCYVVVSKDKEYVQGSFPFTKEGEAQAKEYLKKINKHKEYKIITS